MISSGEIVLQLYFYFLKAEYVIWNLLPPIRASLFDFGNVF